MFTLSLNYLKVVLIYVIFSLWSLSQLWRPQRIPNLSDRLPACCHWNISSLNWFSQAILVTKYKKTVTYFIVVFVYTFHFLLNENNNQIALPLSKHKCLCWTHVDVVLVQWISLNTCESLLLAGRFLSASNSSLSWHIQQGKYYSHTSLKQIYCSLL